MTDLEIFSSGVIALQNQLQAASLRALEIITVTDGGLAEELLQTSGNADFAVSRMVLAQSHLNGKIHLRCFREGSGVRS